MFTRILPLVLLHRASWRAQSRLLFLGVLLTVAGVVLNRINVVLLAMDSRGAMPQVAPDSYAPSLVEWGISIGLIAATIFLFGVGARFLPVLARTEPRKA